MRALISIIIPVYNVAPYLRRCLDSILAQTLKDFEVIAVNDGSDDDSLAILKEYQAKDERIKVFCQENKGLSAARNTGLREANGRYISFIDSDDFVAPEFLECLYEGLIRNKADIAGCDFLKIKNPKDIFKPLSKPKEKIFDDALATLLDKRNFIHFNVWNKLYKREMLDGVWFYEGIYYEDWVFNVMVFVRAGRFVWIRDALYGYRISFNSIMRSSFNQKKFDDYIKGIRVVYEFYQAKYPKLWELVKTRRIARTVKMMMNQTIKSKDKALYGYAAKRFNELFYERLIGYQGLSLANKFKLYRFLHERDENEN